MSKGNAQVEAPIGARNAADFLLRIAPHRGEARICLQIAPRGALPPSQKNSSEIVYEVRVYLK